MGEYYEEFSRHEIPRHYYESQKRNHIYDLHGHHADECLKEDIKNRLFQIKSINHIDTSSIRYTISFGEVVLMGNVEDQRSIEFIINAIDSIEGTMKVMNQLSFNESVSI